MHTFDHRFLRERSVSMEVMNRVARLEGFSQRTRILSLNRESILQSMERIALVMSVRDSNAIEGIRTTDDRLVPLIEGSTKPKGHSEAEIKGYGDCLRYSSQPRVNCVVPGYFIEDVRYANGLFGRGTRLQDT